MKLNIPFILIILFMLFSEILFLPLLKADEGLLNDKEFDEILKNPKYDSMLKSFDLKGNSNKKENVNTLDILGPSVLTKIGSDPLREIEAINSKITSPSPPEDHKSKNEPIKISPEELYFKQHDFLSPIQARYLIELFKQTSFFDRLPFHAQKIIKATQENLSFEFTESKNIKQFLESPEINTFNSKSFVDSDGEIGRKGMLTLIDLDSGVSKIVWAVLNSRVLCYYESQSLLTIVKLYRNSSLKINDIMTTPCFITFSVSQADENLVVCAGSTQDKELWIETIRSHL